MRADDYGDSSLILALIDRSRQEADIIFQGFLQCRDDICNSIFGAFGYFVKGGRRWCKSAGGDQCLSLSAPRLMTDFM